MRVGHRLSLVVAGLLTLLAGGILAASASAASDLVHALPDGRAYEQVTPPDKGGAVMAASLPAGELRVGDAGAITFGTSYSGLPGSPQYVGASQDYFFTRSAQPAWTYAPILPTDTTELGAPGPDGLKAVSADLSAAVVLSFGEGSSATPAPPSYAATNGFGNLILRRSDGSYALITPAPPSSAGYNGPFFLAGSSNFSHVLFEANAPFPVQDGVANPGSSEQLYDYSGGQLWQVGVQSSGTPFAAGAATPVTGANSVSSDGSTIFFNATSDGFAADAQLYARLGDASSVQISPTPSGACVTNHDDGATFEGATADGSVVFFLSDCALKLNSNTGTNDVNADLYEYNRTTSTLTDLSADGNPSDATTGAAAQGVVGFSTTDDGAYVYFTADGQIVPGQGVDNASGLTNLYLAHGGTTTWLATLSTADSGAWTPSTSQYTSAQLTPDGQDLLISSHVSLPGTVTQTHAELYELSAPGYVPTCVSCAAGVTPSGNATMGLNSLSSDGSRVVFQSSDQLPTVAGTATDQNSVPDVYEYEGGALQLISSGAPDSSGATFVAASPSGNDVFFTTYDQLTASDQDGATDLYDARVGGGIPYTPTVQPPACEAGLACLPSQTPAPGFPVAATETATGSNVTTVTNVTTTTTSTASTPVGSVQATVAAIGAAELKQIAHSGVVKLTVKLSRAATVRLSATAVLNRHARAVGTTTRVLDRAATLHLALILSSAARHALAHSHRLAVTLTLTVAGKRVRTIPLNLRSA